MSEFENPASEEAVGGDHTSTKEPESFKVVPSKNLKPMSYYEQATSEVAPLNTFHGVYQEDEPSVNSFAPPKRV